MDEANGAVEEREKKEEEQINNNAGMPLIETNKDSRCPEGYVYINPTKDFYGRYVKGYCRKSKKRHIL